MARWSGYCIRFLGTALAALFLCAAILTILAGINHLISVGFVSSGTSFRLQAARFAALFPASNVLTSPESVLDTRPLVLAKFWAIQVAASFIGCWIACMVKGLYANRMTCFAGLLIGSTICLIAADPISRLKWPLGSEPYEVTVVLYDVGVLVGCLLAAFFGAAVGVRTRKLRKRNEHRSEARSSIVQKTHDMMGDI